MALFGTWYGASIVQVLPGYLSGSSGLKWIAEPLLAFYAMQQMCCFPRFLVIITQCLLALRVTSYRSMWVYRTSAFCLPPSLCLFNSNCATSDIQSFSLTTFSGHPLQFFVWQRPCKLTLKSRCLGTWRDLCWILISYVIVFIFHRVLICVSSHI